MSRGPENTFIASVHKHLPESVYWMKNHNEYNGGIADVWYDGPCGDLWVEYKFIVLPKRSTTLVPVDLSDLQAEWLRDRKFNGRNVAVVVGCKEGGVWFDDPRHWERSHPAAAFRSLIMTRQEIADRIMGAVCG